MSIDDITEGALGIISNPNSSNFPIHINPFMLLSEKSI